MGIRALGEGHRRRFRGRLVSFVALEADLDLLLTRRNGGIGQQIFCAAFQRHPCFADADKRSALSRSIILDGHVADRQLGYGVLHDLSKDGRAQRVSIQRAVFIVRQRNADALFKRDGRRELLRLRQRHFRCRAGKADLVVAILVIGQRGVGIIGSLICASKPINGTPVGTRDRDAKKTLALALALILPLKAVEKRVLICLAHLVKADDQRARQRMVHFIGRHRGLDDGRTVLQRVAAGIRREHDRRERTDLRQQQHRQQARQHPLQFLTCHDVSSFVLFPFCHVGLACPRMHGTLSSHIGVKNTLTNQPKNFNLFI